MVCWLCCCFVTNVHSVTNSSHYVHGVLVTLWTGMLYGLWQGPRAHQHDQMVQGVVLLPSVIMRLRPYCILVKVKSQRATINDNCW